MEVDPKRSDKALYDIYWKHGYVKIPGVLDSGEIKELQEECNRLLNSNIVNKNNLRTLFQMNSGSYPERIDPVIDISPMIFNLSKHKSMLSIVENIFNEKPYLFKDKLIFRTPGVEGYPVHQDYAWWYRLVKNPDKILSVYIAVDDANLDNSPVELFPGLHKKLIAKDRNLNSKEVNQLSKFATKAITLQAGDASILHSLTPHRSEDNKSSTSRMSVYFSYNAESAGDLYNKYYEIYKKRENPDNKMVFK